MSLHVAALQPAQSVRWRRIRFLSFLFEQRPSCSPSIWPPCHNALDLGRAGATLLVDAGGAHRFDGGWSTVSDGGQCAHRPAPIRFARCRCIGIGPPVSDLVPITCACPVERSSMSMALPDVTAQRTPAPATFTLTSTCTSTAVTNGTVCCCIRAAVQLTCPGPMPHDCRALEFELHRSSDSARAIATAQPRSVLRPVARWGCVCTAADPGSGRSVLRIRNEKFR